MTIHHRRHVGIGPGNLIKIAIMVGAFYLIDGRFLQTLEFGAFYLVYVLVGQTIGFELRE